ncbi:carbohydrate ABC transporter permease [Microlunatus parietis]|uniref:Multiple sugar transport system permease protein n=1 Tax=Microlunatus parietis TaxID=682979 RepID=A0A7Y9I307_9ACTN|nr:sugar ABC transporter permease [Microlunatus parietis]NYE69281.1 multiple sugar transport system permease protein [Microlunatus parietis]
MATISATAADPPAAPERGGRPGRRRGTRSGAVRARHRAGWLMVAPALLHALLWIGVPVVAALILSLTSYDVLTPPRFIGLDNYVEALGDPVFRRAMANTAVYAFFTVPVAMAVALVIAVMLNTRLRGRAVFRTAIFLPQVTATIAVALVWLWIYEPRNGLANAVLSFFGLSGVNWLSSTTFAMPAVIVVGIWQGIGLKMLIYLAALQGLPRELFEAASVDGASRFRQFFSITVPLLRPATFFVFVTSVIGAFQSFDQIYILTDGGPANTTTMMTYEIYKSAFREFRMGYACAQSLILFVVLALLTLANRRLTRSADAGS